MNNVMSKLVTFTTAALVAGFLLAPAPVSAVVKSFQVMQNGQPVARTKVTLTSPSGKQYEEETDDDGKIIGFNFNEDGDWKVAWTGGSMMISAGGGVGPWLVVPAAIGVTAAIIAANDSDNNDGPSDGGSPPPNGDISGTYFMQTTVVENIDGHPNDFENCPYEVIGSSGSVQIQCSGTGISFTATGPLDMNGEFTAVGTGMYEGFTTSFTISGFFDANAGTWEGTASGCNGGCPDTNGDMTENEIIVEFTGGID
jgi:hypothetical protein